MPPADDPVPAIRRSLAAWYRRTRRDLPWRRDQDPYRVWVSEIMLQQTRVEAVIPYYQRFLRRYPDVHALARASTDEVLHSWAGLGYYRRARQLHQAARQVVAEHGGSMPEDPDTLRSLPGIGRYTSGAILSICFDQPEPVLDGNVERVLTRLFALEGNPRKAPLKAQLWRRAGRLVAGRRPGDLNQALMELGATVCLPNGEPRCEACPVARHCQARASGTPTRYPELPARAQAIPEHWAVAFAVHRGRVLVRQRRGEALMEGLWELPSTPRSGDRGLAGHLHRHLTGDAAFRGRVRGLLLRHAQAISGRHVTHHVFQVEVQQRPEACRWLPPATLSQRALTTATRRILAQLPVNNAAAQVRTASR